MCLPLAGVAAIAGGLGSISSLVQQGAATSAGNAFGEELQQRQREIAQHSANLQNSQVNSRLIQEQAAAADEIAGITSKARLAKSTALVAGLEGGATGGSLNALLDDFQAQETEFVHTIQRNLAFKQQQATAEKKGIRLGLEKANVGSTFTPRAGPDFLGGALNIGGSIFKAAGAGAFS